MTRRQFMAGAAASIAVVGCGSPATEFEPPTIGSGISVLNWPDYIDPALLERLGEQAGFAPLRYEPAWADNYSGAELFSAEWDIVMPTNWLAAQLIAQGQVERLPVELIPNHANIDPAFLTNDWDRGARFHMPWQAGITGIAYDPELTERELRSFDDLFSPDLRGRVAMIGEMREAIGLTMLADGADPGRPDPVIADRALERLVEANESGQFHSWVFETHTDLLAAGTVAATMAWSGDVVQLQAERPDIEFVIPEEGAVQWFDTMVIPDGARNATGAAQWMNAFYTPELAATNTEWVQYISPVLGVRDVLVSRGGASAELAENPILFPDDETRRRLFIWGGFESIDAENALDESFAATLGIG